MHFGSRHEDNQLTSLMAVLYMGRVVSELLSGRAIMNSLSLTLPQMTGTII